MISGDLKYDHGRNKAVSGVPSPKYRETFFMVPGVQARPNVFKKYAYEATKRSAEGLPRGTDKA
jgi:hypothetical protein